MKVLVLEGPNLNLVGNREPQKYGTATTEEIHGTVRDTASALHVDVEFRQTNHEGVLVDWIQDAHTQADGVVINPGGLTHSSVSILDAILASPLPIVEVHLTNLAAREEFRSRSITARGTMGRIEGFGGYGYSLAIQAIHQRVVTRRSGGTE
jgi:3-dehydroquinate dehydratase-2